MKSSWNRAAALALTLVAASPLSAQLPLGETRLGTGAVFESFDFLDPAGIGIERVSLVSIPLAARVPVVSRVSLDLRGAFARASMLRTDGTEVTLSGLTDTEVRANVVVLPDLLTVSVGALLPTGRSTQTIEQVELAGLIAADLLPFRVSNWGTGGGAGLVSTLTLPAGDFGVGLSAGYTVGREFEPIEEEQFTYRPGNEFRLRLAIDRSVGTAAKASLVLGMQQYQHDQVGGSSAFQPGDRYEALASVAFAAGPLASGAVYAGLQHRGAGTLVAGEFDAPAQDLILVGGGLRIPRGVATLVPVVDLRLFRRSDGVAQGHLTSAGASLEWPAGAVTLVPTVRGRFGKALLWEGEETSVRGAEIGVGLRLGVR